MIAFFPEMYHDELMYSVIARYHQRSGYARLVSTFEDIYQQKAVIPSFEFVNAYKPDALTWITKNNSFELIIQEHTMFPWYAHFLPIEKKNRAFEALVRQEGNPGNYLGIKKTGGERFFRFCPQCASEDRARCGETYWHRSHQIPKVDYCPVHGCRLQNTVVKITSRQSPALYDAESVIPKNNSNPVYGSVLEKELSKYVFDVLSKPVRFISSDIGSYLHYCLDSKYINSRGIARNFTMLYNDFSVFYKGLQIPEAWQMQKIFNGYLRDPFFICQIAFWEGVTPEDLINNEMTHIDANTKQFYEKLSVKYSIDIDIISRIGDDISRHIYEQNRVHAKPGRRSFDYASMDNDLLPKVKQFIKQFYSKEGRPEKLSFRKVEKALSLPPKRFNFLPRCKKYIEQHWESQNEFWARETIWAVRELKQQSLPLNYKRIHQLTNMRFSNLQACYPYIEDSDVKQVVGGIIATLAPKEW